MSDQSSQEPTMEEILASIRRIISEDDGPVADAVAEEPVAEEAAPEPELPVVEEEEDDGALELTDKVETLGDLDVYTPAPASEPEPESAPEPFAYSDEPEPDYTPQPGEGLVGDPAAAAAAAAFGALSSSILMPRDGRTLEDVVRELLRPLLKQWLDTNLPTIVETQVKAEVERIARGGRVG
jgi:cell pole-organizing protein PopZ